MPSAASARQLNRKPVRRFVLWTLVTLVAAIVLVAANPPMRHAALRRAGWALVAQNAVPKSANVIVIATDSEYPSALLAADLVHQGVASRVALFPFSEPWETEYRRRGVPFQNLESMTTQYLNDMGVAQVEHIGQAVTGSENEGAVLPGWCDQHQLYSVVVITTPDHSRRLGRILRRAMKDHHTTFTVVSTPYSSFDPDNWWQSRGGVRTEIEESEKLLLDIVRHPL